MKQAVVGYFLTTFKKATLDFSTGGLKCFLQFFVQPALLLLKHDSQRLEILFNLGRLRVAALNLLGQCIGHFRCHGEGLFPLTFQFVVSLSVFPQNVGVLFAANRAHKLRVVRLLGRCGLFKMCGSSREQVCLALGGFGLFISTRPFVTKDNRRARYVFRNRIVSCQGLDAVKRILSLQSHCSLSLSISLSLSLSLSTSLSLPLLFSASRYP